MMIKLRNLLWITWICTFFGSEIVADPEVIASNASARKSVGSPLIVNAIVDKYSWVNVIQWYYVISGGNQTILTTIDGGSKDGKVNDDFSSRMDFDFHISGNSGNIGDKVTMSLNINTTSEDITSEIKIIVSEANTLKDTAVVKLNVFYCDRFSSGLPPGALSNPAQCEYGCSATLSCDQQYEQTNVTAQCNEDATWNETVVCVEKTTTSAYSTTIAYAEPTTTDASNSNSTDKSTEPTTTAPSNSDSTDNSTGTTTMDDTGRNNDGSNGLSTGAKVGIGIGTCVGVAGIVIVGVLIYKKKNEGYIGGNAD